MIDKLPEELISSLQNIKGFDKAGFTEVHRSGEQITSLRINPAKISGKEFAACEKIPWNPYGYYLSERPLFTLDPLLHAGAYYVQEAASQFLWEILKQNFEQYRKVKALDLCAAPGGKSTLLSSFFTEGFVVANEVIKSRAAILEENITKWGNINTCVTNNDPQHFQRLEGFFDIMLVDAPCSGSGLFRKDHDALQEWSTANVALCSKRQQRILHDAFASLKKDGILIYSTCSYSPQENEEMADYILENFETASLQIVLQKEWRITETISEKHKGYGYRFFPCKVRSEGFYVAVFRKKNGTAFTDTIKNKWTAPSSGETDEIKKWIKTGENISLLKLRNKHIAIKNDHTEWLACLQQYLYLKKAGIEIGEIKNKGLVPAHALAVSEILNREFASLNVDKETALDFLRKKEIFTEGIQPGWTIVKYHDTPLGWLKALPNRANNYYPVEWRILMQQK